MKTAKFQTMKTRISFVAMFFVAFLATSCNVERSEKYQALLAERDSLYTEAVAAKGGFDNALNTINEIENALESIRAQENIIMMENQEGNTNYAVAQIEAIDRTIQQNKTKIAELEQQLAESGSKSKQLNATITRLKNELDEKDTYINNLRDELNASQEQVAQLTVQVEDLNKNVEDLNENINNLNAQSAEQQATINLQDAALNTVYYIVAPIETLENLGLAEAGGLFTRTRAATDINKNAMISADKRQLSVIPLNTKKATILTNHPESSYQLTKGDDNMLSLEIVNPDAFWNISNYLIISIK